MSDTWALRDIGRATTKVSLGFISLADIEDKHTYQEFPLSSLSTIQNSDELKMHPADKWSTHFESFCKNWQSVPQLDAYKLITNVNPDAPRQTLIFGYLSGESDIPDLTTEYFPESSEYIVPGTGGDVTPPAETPSAEEGPTQSFAPPVDTGMDSVAVIQAIASYIQDRPFIPSSIDHLAPDASLYKEQIRKSGIKIHNIWDVYLGDKVTGIKYSKNKGPCWSSSAYAGATAEQGGEPGAMKITVNANKGKLTLFRVAPMNHDIGLDADYPWVFPYVDTPTELGGTGSVKHGALYGEQFENRGLFGNEYRVKGGKADGCFNIGFQMTFDVSAEGPRGAFADSGGGISPNITVAWGWKNINEVTTPKADGNFASSFYVTFAHDKSATLNYNDGSRIVSVPLEDNPANFYESTHLSLTVEYLGTAIKVKTEQGEKVIKAEGGSGGSALKGVKVSQSNISLYVAGCVATFDFTPIYYNSWSPSANIKLGADPSNIEITSEDGENHSVSNLSFNPNKPQTGFAKLIAASCFNTYAKPEVAKTELDSIYSDMLSAFRAQTYTPQDLLNAAENPSVPDNRFKPESGWPQCITDSRSYPINEHPANDIFIPIAKIYNYGTGVFSKTNSANAFPAWAETDPMSTLSVVWQVRTTCTTPLIFGFKTTDTPMIHWPEGPSKDITEYVSKWKIEWAAEQDYKVLRARCTVTLLNPPGYIIDVVSKNRLHIKIEDSGYRMYGQQVNPELKPFIYRQGQIFIGLTVGTNLLFGPGGDVYFNIECVDPIKLLEDYNLETNLRFDGVSYYMAFSSLMQASDYGAMFIAEDHVNSKILNSGWRHTWRSNPATIFPSTTPITWDKIYVNRDYIYNSMFFGYQPMSGRSYEVQAGTQLYSSLMEIIKNMHNPAAIPLFFFRPTDGYFILQVRNADPRVQDMNANYRPRFKSEISSEKDLAMAMPLLCVGNSEAYQMTSDTSNIISHFTVTGIDRATSLAIKATAINPKWLALSSVKSLSSQGGSDWVTSSQVKEPPTNAPMDSSLAGVVGHQGSLSQIYGHLGYKRRVYQPVGNFVANLSGAYAYAVSRCWWLMRPVININNLTSYGIVDFYPDGIVSIELGDITYDKALLKQSSIEYDANEGSIISKFSVFLFPPWTM